ncbi:MotE family protein [Roseomonas chloroacetimidivorans]|uniref:MotE family protein n=1 Tax=Roseomonas chloroacetimidivorans TaxID=1766656 RepID=UPI003C73CE36
MRLPQLPRPRLLPAILAACGALASVKAQSLWSALPSQPGFVASAAASAPPAAAPARAVQAPAPAPDPVDQAERALLTRLRERRTEIDAREQAVAARETVLAAAERRLTERLEEMAALKSRLEALEHGRDEREEAGWRSLVKTYEAMRPRDAATVFDDLEMPVLVQIVNRMREAKAAPVIGAMRPDRARSLTAELARLRAATTRTE